MKKIVNILYLQLFALVILTSCVMFSDVRAQDSSDNSDDRWVLVERNATEEYYYDSLTVSREGDTVVVWMKTIYTEKIKDGNGKMLVSAVNSLHLFCNKKKYTLKDVEVTYQDGSKKEVDHEEKNNNIKPESLVEKVYNIFCKTEE